ncbi:hypothetical protein N8Y23_00505 [Enterobacter hormaechei subsp. xiangfangensis]|nr:hypothetical protein [Enterobacter hormaechei subsp. xiangfangensis]
MKPSYEELEAKCAALAAELSSVLTDRAVILEDLDNTCFEIGMQRGEKTEAYPTPVVANHDAFLAEVRAHDLNAFIQHHSAELDAHIKNGGEQFDEKSVRIRDIIVSARLFREQIRQEAAL